MLDLLGISFLSIPLAFLIGITLHKCYFCKFHFLLRVVVTLRNWKHAIAQEENELEEDIEKSVLYQKVTELWDKVVRLSIFFQFLISSVLSFFEASKLLSLLLIGLSAMNTVALIDNIKEMGILAIEVFHMLIK